MGRLRTPVFVTLAVLIAGLVVPALASPVPDQRDVPRLAIVARGDNPVDALASAPVAGAAGGVVVLTPPTSLGTPARDALVAFDPDVVILAGGESALSKAVFDAVDAAGDWETRRVSGASRYETAAALASVLSEYGLDGLDVSDAIPANDHTSYVQAAGTWTENGQALLDAVAAIPSLDGPGERWTIQLERGTYDLGTRQLVLPVNVTLAGEARASRIISQRSDTGPTQAAAVLVTEAFAEVEGVTVENRGAGGALVAMWAKEFFTVRDSTIGQNTAGQSEADSYGIVTEGSFTVVDSDVYGYSTGTGTGIGLLAVKGFGGEVFRSFLGVQGTSAGATIVLRSGFVGDVRMRDVRFFGFGTAQGLIHQGSGRIDISFSEFDQMGADATVEAGTVNIASTNRDKSIIESGGVAECAYNFTSAMIAIDC